MTRSKCQIIATPAHSWIGIATAANSWIGLMLGRAGQGGRGLRHLRLKSVSKLPAVELMQTNKHFDICLYTIALRGS